MTNEIVIKRFLNRLSGETPLREIPNGVYVYRGRTLTSNGKELINYRTTIAYWDNNGSLHLNKNKYSITTSKIQNQLAYLAKQKNIPTIEYLKI